MHCTSLALRYIGLIKVLLKTYFWLLKSSCIDSQDSSFTVSGSLSLQCEKNNTTSRSVTGYNLWSSVFKSEALHTCAPSIQSQFYYPSRTKRGPWSKSPSAGMSNKNRTPGNGTIPSAEVAPKTVHGERCCWSTVIKGLFIESVVAEKCFKLNFLMCHRQYLIRLQFIASLAENLKEQQFQNLNKKKPNTICGAGYKHRCIFWPLLTKIQFP